MRFLVFSDLHDNLNVIRKVLKEEREFDKIIFLGDLISPFTMREIVNSLPEAASIVGVFGNNDGDKLTILKASKGKADLLSIPRIINLQGLDTILIHGFGSPDATVKIIRSIAKSLDYDLVLYGHTHKGEIAVVNKDKRELKQILEVKSWEGTKFESEFDLNKQVLILNPGELGGWLFGKSTYAIIELKADKKVKIIIKRV